MSLTITYDGPVADLTLSPGDRFWLQSTTRPAAVQAILYAGEVGVLTLALDTASWGTTYALTKADPRPGGGPDVGHKLRAFEESNQARRRQAIEAEARRERATRVNYLRYPWR